MNSNRIIVSVALTLASIASHAGDAVSPPSSGHALTRAEVRAELIRARQAGELGTFGDSGRSFEMSTGTAQSSVRSRADVLAELTQARRRGDLAAASDLYGANLGLGTVSLHERAAMLAEARADSPSGSRVGSVAAQK